jgi:glycosyltransferase involved in cell wall biosynthesis
MGRALEARGAEVLVAATDADGPGRLPGPTGRVARRQGVPTILFPRQASEAFKYSRPLAAWLRARVAEFDVAHVHAVFSHACLAAGGACRAAGVPYVVRPLGSLDPWSLGRRRWGKRLLWLAAGRGLLRGAAAVHYTTEAERRGAEAGLGLARGVVIPLGVDEALLEAGPDRGAFGRGEPAVGDAPYVLALGRIHPKKGLDALIAGFREAVAGGGLDGWRLVVAGDGDPGYVAGLRRLAAAPELGGRVVFPGWLTGDRRRDAVAGAAVLALPSRQENFALAVVEALACGVPVLVSPEVGLADDVRAAGAGWIAPGAPAALRDALLAAAAGGAERARRGAAGRALVRARFTWPAVAAALLDLYARLRRAPGG